VSRTRCSVVHDAPQSRDPSRCGVRNGPRISSAPRRKSGALRSIRGTHAVSVRCKGAGCGEFSFSTKVTGGYGSLRARLCEKSVVQSACRTSVSVSSIRKPIALATSVRRRQLRKQFCASLAHVTFHTAWVINGHRPAARWWLMHGIYLSVDFR
jgi:hypothetical protein